MAKRRRGGGAMSEEGGRGMIDGVLEMKEGKKTELGKNREEKKMEEEGVYRMMTSSFQALRLARAPVAGLELMTGGFLQISEWLCYPLCDQRLIFE
ncbi:hypothetical protein PoB_006188600 [Plakobranchus ocellatus]|uniref:Uncharacterized protein n=1 Tax=Plakobranchus ocellatus TaxID=259542 RepID=A0AAV4CTY6_9GAST|nr:hypothetical protein PoB_006188600 [Plakobranchus ocellatus]